MFACSKSSACGNDKERRLPSRHGGWEAAVPCNHESGSYPEWFCLSCVAEAFVPIARKFLDLAAKVFRQSS